MLWAVFSQLELILPKPKGCRASSWVLAWIKEAWNAAIFLYFYMFYFGTVLSISASIALIFFFLLHGDFFQECSCLCDFTPSFSLLRVCMLVLLTVSLFGTWCVDWFVISLRCSAVKNETPPANGNGNKGENNHLNCCSFEYVMKLNF